MGEEGEGFGWLGFVVDVVWVLFSGGRVVVIKFLFLNLYVSLFSIFYFYSLCVGREKKLGNGLFF